MIQKKMWVKFKDLNIECFCEGTRKCAKEEKPECKEYVVKFILIERSKAEVMAKEKRDELTKKLKKVKTELEKNARKFKKFRM